MGLALALVASSQLAVASETRQPAKAGRVVVTDTSCEILGPLQFAPNDAHLVLLDRKLIKAVAETLLGNPSITLMEVDGHADASETNPDLLGMARAMAVMAALVAEGVPAYRLRVESLGATQPLSTSKLASEQAKNRRIAFLILKRDERL